MSGEWASVQDGGGTDAGIRVTAESSRVDMWRGIDGIIMAVPVQQSPHPPRCTLLTCHLTRAWCTGELATTLLCGLQVAGTALEDGLEAGRHGAQLCLQRHDDVA